MKDDFLRKEVKMLKVMDNYQYKEIAEYLEVASSSFYAWLYGKYNFSTEKRKRLYEIIETLS